MSQYNRNGIQNLDNKKKPQKQDIPYKLKHQGDCVKCDGYDMTCYQYTAYQPKMVSPCVTKWNMGDLEKKCQ